MAASLSLDNPEDVRSQPALFSCRGVLDWDRRFREHRLGERQ
jgi:hypothetical protein